MIDYDKYEWLYYPDGSLWCEKYSLNNRYHRLDGPAYLWYYTSGELGRKEYFLNGQHHRTDGPACTSYFSSGQIEFEKYYLNGECMNRFVNLMRESSDKTKTLTSILNENQERAIATILINIFRNDIDPNVINNLELFI